MRAVNWYGLVAVLSFAAGCGGESSNDDAPPDPGEQGGEGAGPPGSGGNGEAGEGPGSGGKATGGKTGAGGATAAGGSSSPGGITSTGATGPIPGGAPPTMGGAPSVPPVKPPPPAGGAPGGTPVPVEGCELTSQTASINYCQQFLTCTGTQVLRECQEQGPGLWSCFCSNAGGRTYEVRGAAGIAACEAMAAVCEDTLPEEVGAEECSLVREVREVNNCELQEQCSVRLDVDEPRISRVTGGTYLNCFNDGLGGSTCNCAGGTYQLQGATSPQSCDLLVDVCSTLVSSPGEETCKPTGESVGPGHCTVQQQCSTSHEIADGVNAVRTESRFAECFNSGSGTTLCICAGQEKSNQIELETATPNLSSCNLALSLCGKTDAIELTGEIECTQSSQSAAAGYCNSNLNCSQSGTLEGVGVRLTGALYTSCAGGASSWNCTCASGTASATTSVNLSGDPWADCTAAADACRELVDVQIGVGAGGVGMPVPFK